MDELWKAFLGPPRGRDLEFFCNLISKYDKRFPETFLENFIILFNSLRGSHSIDTLPQHLLKIFKKIESNQDGLWNLSDDPQYLLPQSLMLKLFHHVRDKTKERERVQRRKEKQKKVDDANRLVVSLRDAIDDLWIAFLTPPRGHIRTLIAILANSDTRFPTSFLEDFMEIFNHLSGLNTSGKEDYVKIFQDVDWSPHNDPEYKIPKSLMEDLFKDLIEDLSAEETVTAQEVEETKERKRKKLLKDSSMNSVAFKKVAYREARLGRDVAKKETHLKITSNRFKNTLKKK